MPTEPEQPSAPADDLVGHVASAGPGTSPGAAAAVAVHLPEAEIRPVAEHSLVAGSWPRRVEPGLERLLVVSESPRSTPDSPP